MSLKQHAVVSVVSGVALGLALRSISAAVACVVVGIFIDLDHLIDFWMNRGLRLSAREFLDFCYFGTSPTFLDLLHGWEYVPLLASLTAVSAWRPEAIGATVGYTLHLLGDQVFNRHLHRFTYFITYRVYHRFDSGRIVLYNPFLDDRAG